MIVATREVRTGLKLRETDGRRGTAALGALGPLAITTSLGVALAAVAMTGARDGHHWARAVFWASVLLIAAPIAFRVCGAGARRRERLGLVIVLTIGLYLVKLVYDPTSFSFSDEFVHWRSTLDLLSTGSAFGFNPLLPIASHYPGLPGLTAEIVQLTGVSVPAAGFILVGVARLLLMMTLFLIFERLSSSSRIASIGCLLYVANPNFLYWDAQFSYESLGLPLAFLVVFLIQRRAIAPRDAGVAALSMLAVVAVVVTHHLSTYTLLVVLAFWSVLALVRRQRSGDAIYAPVGLLAFAMIAAGLWVGREATGTFGYVGGIFSQAAHGVINVITGAGGTRSLFTSGTEVPPFWERALSYAAAAILLLALAWAIRPAFRRYRTIPLGAILLLLAVAYPVTLPLRLVSAAQETANRSSEYVFAGLGLVISTLIVITIAGRRWRSLTAALLALVVFMGGVAVSWQYSQQLPPAAAYRGEPNAVDYESSTAASWARAALGPGNRFASDQIDTLALATYGEQRTLWASTDGASAWQIFLPPAVNAEVVAAIRRGHVGYLLVQRRLSRGLPSGGVYFDKGEPSRSRPISPVTLGKFDRAAGVSRLFDDGDIQVYDVQGITAQR